ncbi:MAG: hypothetical protein OIN89_04160 [Candidatus Methanoperedens sp.]|jgi:hypothetical protein|nr:hypothetical protein [Candidatus Methanoperedens sp.]PKL53991.1 MAG: hypothetical protein CVV36_04085 [Candidatus Methanoperedenaceae archaeon HGW-Methanoperedenaceae-1]
MENSNRVEIAILNHLFKHGYIGKRHTPFKNALKGIPMHQRGEAKAILENLIKRGLVSPYQTGHGMDVRINPDRIQDVKRIIGLD